MAGFDVQGARNAGYSDAEIAQHLASTPGIKFDVDGALKAGYSPTEVIAHVTGEAPPKSTGFIDALRHGAANVAGGVGETLTDYGAPGVGGKFTSAAQAIDAPNYAPASVIDKEGVHVGDLPRAVVESAPGMVGPLAAAKVMPGGAIPKLLAGSAMYALQTLGNRAKERAANNEREVPTTEDKTQAAIGMVPEALLGTIGYRRFLPGAGEVASVGAKGVAQAVKELGKTALSTGIAGAAQDVAGQAGSTYGTKKGLEIDPLQTANSAAVGAATGGALGTPKAIGEASGAIKYRKFGGANADATASVANDIAANAPGGDVERLAPSVFNSRGKAGFNAVDRAANQNRIALNDQIAELKKNTNLPPDAQHALERAAAGDVLTEGDHATIDNAVKDAPNGDLISFLARKSGVHAQLQEQGVYDPHKGTFTGGGSNRLINLVKEHSGKTALAALAGEGAGVHMIAYSPYALGAAAAGGSIMRAIDRMTGNLSPGHRFASRFANPNVQAPQVVQPPIARPGPTGPQVAPVPLMAAPGVGPWGMVPVAAAAGANPAREQIRDATELMAARRANAALARQQQNSAAQEAVPLLRKLAATRGQTANPEELLSQQITDAQDLTAARRANEALQRQQATPLLRKLAALKGPNAAPIDLPADFAGMLSNPGAAPAPQPEVPQVVPKQTIASARALVRGLAAAQALKAKTLGANQANDVAAQSPLIAENGGLATVANPEAGKRMAQMVSAAQAYRKLTAQPEAEEAPAPEAAAPQAIPARAAPAPTLTAPVAKAAAAPAAVKKSNGKIHVETQADEYRVPMDTYHKLTDEQAAERIAQDMNAAGTVARGVSRVKVGILRNRKAISDLAAQTGAEAPNLALEQNIAAQFKGITTQKGAKAHREWLKKHYPEEAPALDKYFSDENIERIWKTKGS